MNLRMRWASAAGLAIAVWACCGGAPAESTGHVPRIVIHGGDKKPRERNVRVFQNREGVITLTNKPESYANKPGYREIEIEFDPITVPAFFRALSEDDLATDASIERLARHYAALHGLEPALVLAIIKVESNGDRTAVSHAGAQGLMQLMPGTAADMGVNNPFDPAENIAGGTQYLAKLIELFDGNIDLALAGYNAGPGAVQEYGGIPPYKETQDYVVSVKRWWGQGVRRFGGRAPKRVLGASRATLVAKAGAREPAPASPDDEYYTVHFTSGKTQPAEKVSLRGRYYYIHFKGRNVRVRKDRVSKIVAPA